VLVVTTSEPPAITDAYAMIKVLSQMQYRGAISVLVNFAKDRHDGRDTFARIAGVARKFLGAKVYDGGFILADERVSQAVRAREPFVLAYPKCGAAKCLAAVATKLFSSDVYSHPKEGFFGRVANWFA
jgi:flagellar biosynthesis protein FlhG